MRARSMIVGGTLRAVGAFGALGGALALALAPPGCSGATSEASASDASDDAVVDVVADASVDGEADACTGPCGQPTSCLSPRPGTDRTCGGADGATDCCESPVVQGGTFLRDYDGIKGGYWDDPSFPATISDFRLDTFEATVGRFRAFVEAGMGTQQRPPPIGAGAHPKIAGSGWTAELTARLTKDRVALDRALTSTIRGTYTKTAGAQEHLPMIGITWVEAFAFCAWDGGRLPTSAEWNYAAAGGNEQRLYPWGKGLDRSRASYDCGATRDGDRCTVTDIAPVGSTRAGDGKWGQADLIGSAAEWMLDSAATGAHLMPCSDCAQIDDYPSRQSRGFTFDTPESWITINGSTSEPADARAFDVGIRCARDP